MTTYTPKEFAAHLATVGMRLHPEATRIVNKAANNIRDEWRSLAKAKNPPGSRSAGYPHTIRAHYATITNGVIEASVEAVAPSQKSHAKLGVILEYGGPHNAPQRSNLAALNKEAPNLAEWLLKAARDAI